ncbi:hypothetical protein K7711_19665 [Nocardia sp. CA2R105]|uniref:hypothetical protein n=1 Tax=Nocardia coffeae TaxID=2873381 RepID=UPI001CA6FE7B|nr:hypothetical protein [Nocardia coffeae]MBY8858702.1 hypothetical protein [Nocardia coffeae]
MIDTYLSELMPKLRRGRMIAIAYTIGFFAPGGRAARRAPGRRLPLPVGGLAVVAAVRLGPRSLPESARWPAEHGRGAEADRVVSRIEREFEAERDPLPEPEPAAPVAMVYRISDERKRIRARLYTRIH